MNTKYFILIVALLAVIHYLLAGSAPPATPARAASQARVGPIAPSPSVAPTAPVAPIAPIGIPPVPSPVAPVDSSPIAPLAPVPQQNANPGSPVNPNAYTYTYGSNGAYFTNGIPRAYLRNTKSVSWATNPPYGNLGYTNKTIRGILPYRRIPAMGNTSSPSNN